MFRTGNIVYGKNEKAKKRKYLISIYCSETLSLLAVLPTSQVRCGVENPKHGIIKNDKGDVLSYYYEAKHRIGKAPNGSDVFFPLNTTVVFDYAILDSTYEDMKNQYNEGANLLGSLSEEEYYNLVYAMYKSPKTKNKYKELLNEILIANNYEPIYK